MLPLWCKINNNQVELFKIYQNLVVLLLLLSKSGDQEQRGLSLLIKFLFQFIQKQRVLYELFIL